MIYRWGENARRVLASWYTGVCQYIPGTSFFPFWLKFIFLNRFFFASGITQVRRDVEGIWVILFWHFGDSVFHRKCCGGARSPPLNNVGINVVSLNRQKLRKNSENKAGLSSPSGNTSYGSAANTSTQHSYFSVRFLDLQKLIQCTCTRPLPQEYFALVCRQLNNGPLPPWNI